MTNIRKLAASLCGTICVLGLLYGVILTYASRVLFDASMFSDRVASCLAEPPIARLVSNQIVDQVIGFRRDLTPYRPILLGTVEQIVASAQFRAVVRHAAKKVHPILISEGEALALTVGDLGVISRDMLAAHPDLAQKLPEKAQLVLGATENWPNGKRLLQVIRIGHRMKQRSIIWLGVGLLAGAVGLLLTRRKDRYLLRVGIGLTLAALFLAAIARFGGPILAGFTRSPVASDLVRGLWPVFLGPLGLRMLIMAGLGIALTASAASLLDRVNPGAVLLAAWARARRRPVHPLGAILHGLVVALCGVLIALRPSVALEVAAVLVGAVLLFIGIQEMFTTATRFAASKETEVVGRKAKGRRSYLVAAGAAAVLIALVGAGVFWVTRDPAEPLIGPPAIVACNGYPELCDRSLNEVVFPTTHNSMSASSIADWMFANQERGIREQLEDGVRGFLIDIHYGEPMKGRIRTLLENETNARQKYERVLGKVGLDAAMRIRDRLVGEPDGKRQIYLAHGFCELGATPFVDALEEINDFLVQNPHEVLIIVIQDEGVAPADVAEAFRESGLEQFVYRGSVTPPWPTLGEMVARDERVVVLAENNAEGVPWYHLMTDVVQETPYGFKELAAFSNVPNRGGTKGSLLLMNHWIESAPASLPSNAQIVNAYDVLFHRAENCRKERKMVPNLVAVDFYETGDLFRVSRALNGIPEPDSAAAQ